MENTRFSPPIGHAGRLMFAPICKCKWIEVLALFQISDMANVFVSKSIVYMALLVFTAVTSAVGEDATGDWIGLMSSGFKVRIHIDKSTNGYSGHLTNPSGNETELDQVTSDGKQLHFAVVKLALSYDGVWSNQDQMWKGDLNFQQIYPLALTRATAKDLQPAVHKRPQEDAIKAGLLSYVQRDVLIQNRAWTSAG